MDRVVCVAGLPGPSKPEAKGIPAGNWRKWMSYYVPVTAWIPGYSWSLYVSPHLSSVHSLLLCIGESPLFMELNLMPLCFSLGF